MKPNNFTHPAVLIVAGFIACTMAIVVIKQPFTIFGMWLIVLAIAFYFLPCVIAMARNSGQQKLIFVINFLFGWTVLGWLAALIWAIVEAPLKAD